MIVPHSRLLIYVAALGLPAATLAGTFPALLLPCLGVIFLLVLLALIDALRAGKNCRQFHAALPAQIRATVHCPSSLTVLLSNRSPRPSTLRLGLRLPSPLGPKFELADFTLPPVAEAHEISWPFQARQRGDFQIDRLYYGADSPFRLWTCHQSVPVNCRISIYPNLQADRKQLAALFLNRGPLGLHSHRQMGQGREVEKLREYVPGDGFETVHWKATARRGQPITKIYQVERTQDLYVIIDASRLSTRTAPEGTGAILERFLNAALLLGLAAQQQGDRFGLLVFNDRITRFLPAGQGSAHRHSCREALYNVAAARVSPDFEELTTFVRTRLRRRALLVFLTNLDDPLLGEHFLQCANLLKRKHLVFAPILEQAGVQSFLQNSALETPAQLYSALGNHLVWEKEQELQKALRVAGVQAASVRADRLCAQIVSHYLNIKRRQLL